MTEFYAANQTKYRAGGTGDNIISDGYIKTVEKVWMDSFAFTSVLTTADTVEIATIPANKKITDVEVYLPASMAPTDVTINVGTVGDADKFISEHSINATTNNEIQKLTMNNPDGFQFVTTAETDIFLALANKAITAPTAGTIKTIVRYT